MKTMLKTYCPQLDEAQRERLAIYWDMLLAWNERVNLTAITDTEEAAKKHFADSLMALPFIPANARCIDVGTGAGFPGIPLLIARPDIRMTLLDSLNKRIRFLEAVVEALNLDALCLHARAEDAGRDKAQREAYDIALSRAVAPLPVLLELTVPFLKVGGTSLAYKADVSEELQKSARALSILNCSARVETIQADYGQRTLVLAQKQAACPPAYPRRAGLPERAPL